MVRVVVGICVLLSMVRIVDGVCCCVCALLLLCAVADRFGVDMN